MMQSGDMVKVYDTLTEKESDMYKEAVLISDGIRKTFSRKYNMSDELEVISYLILGYYQRVISTYENPKFGKIHDEWTPNLEEPTEENMKEIIKAFREVLRMKDEETDNKLHHFFNDYYRGRYIDFSYDIGERIFEWQLDIYSVISNLFKPVF